MPTKIDLSGKRFGRLQVASGGLEKICQCVCDCGMTANIRRSQLIDGRTKSCGCLRRDVTSASKTIHGMYGSPELAAFKNAKNRCNRESDVRFSLYGGRGIRMLFASFEEFFDHLGPRPSDEHSLDRIDPDGDYEPGNVRWAVKSVQARNKSTSIIVEIDGVKRPLKDWCEQFGQSYKRAWERIKDGWTPVDAVMKPVGPTARRVRKVWGEVDQTVVHVEGSAQ